MNLDEIFPSQLYINREKIDVLLNQIQPFTKENIPPISIRKFDNRTVFLDGHTRALLAYQNGLSQVPVYWEKEEYDWLAYEECLKWCEEAGVTHISKLSNRIIEKDKYQILWIKRCEDLFSDE